jgi:hypothetical protein
MVQVKVLKRHAMSQGIGVWPLGAVYRESPLVAAAKVRAGFVEYVDPANVPEAVRTKEDPDMYRTRTFSVPAKQPEPVELVGKTSNWYTFSDGSKVLGKRAAAEKLGVTVEELESTDVDSDAD